MEGKVELPISRYEELTKIEREGFAKAKELEANMDKVLIIRRAVSWADIQADKTTYECKDAVSMQIVKNLEATEEKLETAKDKLRTYEYAPFWTRWKYLWTGKL